MARSSRSRRPTQRLRSAENARQVAEYDPGPWVDFHHSTRVARARYDSKQQMLEVEWFKRGIPYIYIGVPSNVWANMRRVKSVGKFVNRVLNQYPYAPKVD